MKHLLIGMFRISAIHVMLYVTGMIIVSLAKGYFHVPPDTIIALLHGLLFWVLVVGAWLAGGGWIHLVKGGKGNEQSN